MILRRLAQNLKEQNWAAIFIEFVLLVLGVFLGIQVANWNEDRHLRAQEREFLERVRAEITTNRSRNQTQIDYLTQTYASATRLDAFLLSGQPCQSDCWPLVVDAFYASQWLNLRPTRRTYDEMQRLGLPRDSALGSTLSTYYTLSDGLIAVTSTLPEYRTLARSTLPAPVQKYLWQTCHQLDQADGGTERLAKVCAPGASEEESRAILERLRADARVQPALTYWMSTIALVQVALQQQAGFSQNAIAAVDRTLARR